MSGIVILTMVPSTISLVAVCGGWVLPVPFLSWNNALLLPIFHLTNPFVYGTLRLTNMRQGFLHLIGRRKPPRDGVTFIAAGRNGRTVGKGNVAASLSANQVNVNNGSST